MVWCLGIHVFRREEQYVGNRVVELEVLGKRTRGRPKRMWLDKIKNDLLERALSREDRVQWRHIIRKIDPA